MNYLTVIPRARMGSETIAHEADYLKLDFNPFCRQKAGAFRY